MGHVPKASRCQRSGHKETSAILHRILKDAYHTAGFRFLDIACGDAHHMKETLSDTRIETYHAIDMSREALLLAKKNLQGAPFDVELEHGDFVDAIQNASTGGKNYTVCWCSLSIHHLTTPHKKDFMEALRVRHGCQTLLIYEPTSLEGEGHIVGYMERYRKVTYDQWTMLTTEEQAQVIEHTSTCDLPQTSTEWQDLGKQAGFSKTTELYVSDNGLFRLYRFDV